MARLLSFFLIALILPLSMAAGQDGGNSLSVLTFNIWGLYPLVGGKAAWRYEEIATRLSRYDVVALQEAWDSATEVIVERSGFPAVARGKHAHRLVGGSGLITLSRFPIVEQEHMRFDSCAGFDCLARKGALRARLQLPDGSLLDVYNTHLNAWLKLGKEDVGARVRSEQIQELARWIKDRSVGVKWLLLGDTNSPEGSQNYREMEREFDAVDIFRAVHPNSREMPGFTYDRTNPWTLSVPESLFGSMRIDYIWADPDLAPGIHASKLEFLEPVRKGKPLSDHFGVSARILLPRN